MSSPFSFLSGSTSLSSARSPFTSETRGFLQQVTSPRDLYIYPSGKSKQTLPDQKCLRPSKLFRSLRGSSWQVGAQLISALLSLDRFPPTRLCPDQDMLALDRIFSIQGSLGIWIWINKQSVLVFSIFIINDCGYRLWNWGLMNWEMHLLTNIIMIWFFWQWSGGWLIHESDTTNKREGDNRGNFWLWYWHEKERGDESSYLHKHLWLRQQLHE